MVYAEGEAPRRARVTIECGREDGEIGSQEPVGGPGEITGLGPRGTETSASMGLIGGGGGGRVAALRKTALSLGKNGFV